MSSDSEPPDRPDLVGQTVLVVDDEPASLGVLSEYLEGWRCKVLIARDGASGLERARLTQPDLILLDVLMPGLDGYQVCEQLKADERTRDIPVIFISSADQALDKVHGFAAGGVDYIAKPFKTEEVLARVQTHLAMHALQQQLAAQNAQLRREIVERQRAEEALKAANEELSQYASVVSHDLQEPLRAIHNYADFLHEDLALSLTGDQQRYLDGLGRAVREAQALVKDLLELSHIGYHRAPTEAIDLGVFLRTLIAALNLPADIEVDVAADWPSIATEPTLLRQVFQNLILNGVKFNHSKTKRIALGWREAGPEQVELFVRDNGIGIEARYQAQIFRMFQRLHTQEEYAGTGMGLAIVQKAAAQLQGAVRVESQPGEGSTFFVMLPRRSGSDEN